MQSGLLTTLDLNMDMEFPLRICDLCPNTHVAITIWDLSKTMEQGLLGSTIIDIFDEKTRMRQGSYSLFIWKGKQADLSVECKTPGLFVELPENISNEEIKDLKRAE